MNFRDVNLVAGYERKMMTRNFVFVFLAFFLVGGVLIFHVFAHSYWNIDSYAFRMDIPSAIPYTNAYLFCVFQAFLTIFIAGDFIKREPSRNTNEALLSRPVGNAEYVTGKGLAIVELLVMLDIVLMVLTGILHVFAIDSVFSPSLYLFYFLALTLPAILFTMALIVCVKMFIHSRVLALLVLLFFLWMSLTLLPSIAHGITDFTASRVPSIFSPIAGHPGMGSYLLQRLVFVCLSMGFFTLSILKFRRLSERWKHAGWLIAFCFGAGIVTGFIYLSPFERQSELRELYRAVYRKHDNAPKVDMVEHEITFRQEGERLFSTSELLIENRNKNTVDTLLFYLNPGLEVFGLAIDGKETPFKRDRQVILVPFNMQPGERSLVTMNYSGKIEENICYPDIANREFQSMDFNNMLCTGHRFFFLSSDFTLLTPESIWYPTTIPVVNIGFPWISRRDYTLYRLNVVNPVHKTILSQGEISMKGDTTCFNNNQNLFGIVLVAGNMDKEQFRDRDFASEYYYPRGEFPCQGAFIASDEGKKQAIEKIKWQFVTYYGYPYDRVALVEVPVSFHTFIRPWRGGTDYIHPELFLVPERRTPRLADDKDFLNKKTRSSLAHLHGGSKKVLVSMAKTYPPADIEANIIVNNFEILIKAGPEREFLSWLPLVKKDETRNYFTAESWNKYECSFLGKEGSVLLSSSRYPMINSIFKAMKPDELLTSITQNKAERDMEAIDYLSGNSLKQAFQPGVEIPGMKDITRLKGRELWNRLQNLVGDSFVQFVDDFNERYKYKEVDFDVFCEELNHRFNVDMYPLLDTWYTGKGVPAFAIRDIQINKDREKERATIYFKIWNKSDVEGIVRVDYENKAQWGSYQKHTLRYVTIAPRSCLEVALPASFKGYADYYNINTGLSWNIPELFVVHNPGKVWVDRESIQEIDTTRFSPANEIIVDNEDEGFVIHEEQSSYFKKPSERKGYNVFPPDRSEWRWTLFVSDYAHGDVIKSFYSKAGGSGKSRVEWNASIKEAGMYELFIRHVHADGNPLSFENDPSVEYSFFHDGVEDKIFFIPPVQTETKKEFDFTVKLRRANGGEEEFKLDQSQRGSDFYQGWYTSGKYELSPGDVKVVLQDKGLLPGKILTADAVKWVKID